MENISKLKKNTVIYLIIYVAVIAAFILFLIYPNHKRIIKLNEDIIRKTNEINQQEMLGPLFKKLLAKTREKDGNIFPVIKSGKFPKGEIAGISSIFSGIAEKNKLIVIKSEPDVNTLKEGSDSLRVNLSLKGDYTNFRPFLMELNKIEYLKEIGSIQIDASHGIKELRLKIWLALDNS